MNFGAMFANFGARVKDPFMIFAIASFALGIAAAGFFYLTLGRHEKALAERQQKAVQDSTRYAAVMRERKGAEVQRDSVVRQLTIIRSLDAERYVWPHILDELSAALPPFTWLQSVIQTTAVPSIASRDSVASKKAKQIAAAAAAAEDQEAANLGFRVIGRTVDFGALTRYMTLLEASPFIQGVTLVRSTLVNQDGQNVTEFTLDMKWQAPDSTAIKRVPLSIAVK